VSWYDVVKWCNAKSEKEGLAPAYSTNNGTVFRAGHSDYYGPRQVINSGSNGYRLPTENEWESAARGGVSSGNFTYSGSNFLNAVAWTADNSSNATKAIGTKTANELGIHDMSGNVWEWCEDGGDAYMDAGSWIDPSSGQTVNGGMFYYYARLRGGSWNSSATHCAISYRGNVGNTFWSYQPGLAPYGYIDNTIGFRLARNSGQ
jgi:formylglycine-generating enzyme required for sulfatase activity